MCGYYEEPYYEPSATDEILMEYQQKMKDVLLESIKSEIKSIKEENERLKKDNERLHNEVSKIAQRERDLEIKKNNLVWEVRRERLSKLMKDYEVVMYRAYSLSKKFPKCNKCDENRRINFKSPSGKYMYESCSCDVNKSIYTPMEYRCTEFRIDRDDKKMLMWFKLHEDRDYDWYQYQNSNVAEVVYQDGMNYENLKRHDTYFKSKEECQKYCDWLNENNKETYSNNAKVPKTK